MRYLKPLLFLLCAACAFASFAQDMVEWRGPGRQGVYPDTSLLSLWPEGGPKLLLEVDSMGNGYSSPVVYRDQIYITGKKDTFDVVSCYSLDGRKNWETKYGRAWSKTFPETRSTPSIEENRIFLVSGMGEVCCIDAFSGKMVWTVDAQTRFKGAPHRWGIAESPAVSDKAVFYVTGGEEASVVALDKNDGHLLWKTKSLGGTRAYASSVVIRKGELELLLAQTANDLMAIDPDSGEIVWSFHVVAYHPGETGVGANTNTPLVSGDDIFLTSGYDHPALMLHMAPDWRSVNLKWTNPDLDNHMGGVVKLGNYIFGSNWTNNNKGNWMCVDWETGRTLYQKEWHNKGPVIAADGMLYYCEEKSGNVALVKPNPEYFELISSFKLKSGTGPVWAHPAIYDGKLLARRGESLMVYDLKK